jgi:hypothetical protein
MPLLLLGQFVLRLAMLGRLVSLHESAVVSNSFTFLIGISLSLYV